MGDDRSTANAGPATVTGGAPGAVDMADAPDGFVPLRIKQVVPETRDAVSIVLDVPGQCGTVRLPRRTIPDAAGPRRRTRVPALLLDVVVPAVGEDLRITVKRDRDGAVSNWLNDTAAPGDRLYALPPQVASS